MGFELDTSGDVGPMPAGPMNERFLGWSDLSPFTQGYIEALFADVPGRAPTAAEAAREADSRMETAAQDSAFCRGARGQSHRGKGVRDLRNAQDEGRRWREVFILTRRFSDLAPETLARIIADCEAQLSAWGADNPAHGGEWGRAFFKARQAGDFPAFPPLTVQLGDDGKVRLAS